MLDTKILFQEYWTFINDVITIKIYATTSSKNYPSMKLLETYGFKLEGRLREHYWINDNKYDQLVYSLLKKEWIKE